MGEAVKGKSQTGYQLNSFCFRKQHQAICWHKQTLCPFLDEYDLSVALFSATHSSDYALYSWSMSKRWQRDALTLKEVIAISWCKTTGDRSIGETESNFTYICKASWCVCYFQCYSYCKSYFPSLDLPLRSAVDPRPSRLSLTWASVSLAHPQQLWLADLPDQLRLLDFHFLSMNSLHQLPFLPSSLTHWLPSPFKDYLSTAPVQILGLIGFLVLGVRCMIKIDESRSTDITSEKLTYLVSQ